MPTLLAKIRRRYSIVVNCSGNTDERDDLVVCSDPESVGLVAANHLLEKGLRSFAFCGWSDQRLSSRRLSGYCRALQSKGFDCSRFLVPRNTASLGAMGVRRRRSGVLTWLRQLPKPVGILTVDDNVARKLASLCAASRIRVPEEVAILGVNNDDLQCETSSPPLSSVDPDFERIGYEAAARLHSLMNLGEPGSMARIRLVPPKQVIQRGSTDVFAVDEPTLAAALRFIHRHACDPCGVKDVVRAVSNNRRWLERHFLRALGQSPHERIVQVRMAKAKAYLLNTAKAITEISAECGYADARNFVAAFKKHQGETPGSYRRRNRLEHGFRAKR